MHSPQVLKIAARSVGTPTPTPSVQLKVSNATHAEAIITTLHCAKGDAARTTDSKEATSPSVTPVTGIFPVAPHGGTAAEVIACVVIPGPLPTVLPVVHHPGTPLVSKGAQLPTGTTRML